MVLVAQSDIPRDPTEFEPNFNDINSLVNVYLMREKAGKWVVHKRHENVVYRGYGDRPGSVLFPKLGKGKPGLAIVFASTDHGCGSETMHLYDLGDDPLRDLANISIGSSTNGNCGGDDKYEQESTSSTWHLAPSKNAASLYDDVVVSITDEKTFYPKVENTEAPPPLVEKFSARYAYDGKRYKLVAGKNPMEHP